jgi:uncharacterized phage protein (TIGR02220 family)
MANESKSKSNREHAFDFELAEIVGIEKAILLKNFHHWTSENQRRKIISQFKNGIWWTAESLTSLAKKYKYMKRGNLSRWLHQLSEEKWLLMHAGENGNNYYAPGPVFLAWDTDQDWQKVFQIETGNCFTVKQRKPKKVFQNEIDAVSNRNNGVFQIEMTNNDIEKNIEIKDVEIITPQAAFITTHTPTEFENVRIVQGETFDLEEKSLEPITPAARELSELEAQSVDEARQVFAAIEGKKARTTKPDTPDVTAETIAYLNEKAGTSFRATSKATKAQINARAKEGYTVEDFKAVIDFKTAEWGTDAKMMQYLCPETLFRASKFEGYLQAAKRAGMIGGQPATRYSLEDRPQATTPEQMKVELSRFYNAHKDESLLDQVQRFAETNYTPERLRSIVIDFCGNQVAKRREGETFGQHHAALGLWLKRQKQFDTHNTTTTQHTAGPQPQAPLRSAAPVNYSQQGPQLRSEQKAE